MHHAEGYCSRSFGVTHGRSPPRRAGGGPVASDVLVLYLPAAREVKSYSILRCFSALHPRDRIVASRWASELDLGLDCQSGDGPTSGVPRARAIAIGIGYLTSIACIAGLYLGWKMADRPGGVRSDGVHPVAGDDLRAHGNRLKLIANRGLPFTVQPGLFARHRSTGLARNPASAAVLCVLQFVE